MPEPITSTTRPNRLIQACRIAESLPRIFPAMAASSARVKPAELNAEGAEVAGELNECVANDLRINR